MKKQLLLLAVSVLALAGCSTRTVSFKSTLPATGSVNFMLASDMGRENGGDQAKVAALMGRFADENRVDFVAVAGDPIHDDGVKSTTDPEWNIRIENIYTAPSLHAMPWYVVSGNHEYHGSVQAVLDYSDVSERWNAPARYFSMTRPIPGDGDALFVFLDTAPLIDKYRDDEENEYTDAGEQDMERELAWLDSVLVNTPATWKIVIGHHPVYADTDKNPKERSDMRDRVEPILDRGGVDFYMGGHIHNFQHIKPEGSSVNYIVNSSASRSRKVAAIPGTIFCNPEPGFSAFSVSEHNVSIHFIDDKGQIVYSQTVSK